jgi:hypothetical protein
MSVQFKFRDGVGKERRREIVDALGRAGFRARSLFPDQKRPQLASVFTVTDADEKDVKAMNSALTNYARDIEYVEAAPKRKLKT